MNKYLAGAAPVALIAGAPLFAALIVGPVTSPAAGQELAATQCEQGGPQVQATGDWRVPTSQRYVITSGFGPRSSPGGGIGSTYHEGADIAMLPGPGSVLAAAAGKVTVAGPYGGLGNAVVIDNGGGISTTYGHMAKLDPAMHVGSTVSIGQRLGLEGSTGNSTGNHLHFGVAVDGKYIDPLPFMTKHKAPLNGQAVAPSPPRHTGTPKKATPDDPGGEGGIGFPLPAPGKERRKSLHNPAIVIPSAVKGFYVKAAARYKMPWPLLAGIGMEETTHGMDIGVSSAGAQGLMQFMPATWATYGVDGDGDGRADITNGADSVMSAANYLTKLGVTDGPAGVKKAIWSYNHATWYVNDILFYAKAYGGGTVLGDPTDCGSGGEGDPGMPAIADKRIKKVLGWAKSHLGDNYVMGANGPHTWDCASFSAAAYAQAGVTIPRTAGAQRNWLAAGNGFKVPAGKAEPGDLIFYDSYLGPNKIGHVEMVYNPANNQAIGAQNPKTGVTMTDYAYNLKHKHIFEIWRVGNVSDHPSKAR